MAAAKESADVGANQVTEDSNCYKTDKVGVRNFKFYPSNVKIKVDVSRIGSVRKSIIPARKMSVLHDKGAHVTTASDTKVGLKCAENIKGKSVYSGNQGFNMRRKALADISNARGSSSRNATCDGSKPLISVGPGSRAVNASSRKSSKGRISLSQKIADVHLTRKAVTGLKASSDDRRTNTKNPCHEFVIYNSRKARSSLTSMRKSSLVLTKESQTDKSDVKNDKDSEKVKRRSLFSGKMSKNVEQVSISRSYLQRTKTSDGSVAIVPKDQTIMHARGSSRKFKPTGKTTVIKFNSQRKLTSKSTAVNNKSTSFSDKSNKSHKSVKSSPLDHISVVVPHETTEKPSSDSSSKSTMNKTDTIVRRKSDRRSYTSSLMAKSKLLLEHGEVQQEKVPSIDDNCNQLEVAEYVDEIYQFYWTSERHNFSLANYMSVQTEITPQMRSILINWLIEVHLKFELMQETLYLMVMLLDQYLSQVEIEKKELQLVGLTALLLASKYEDFWHPRIKDLLSISAESYTRDQMLAMEKLFLKKLKFRLNVPTLYVFMLRFLKAAQSDLKLEHLAFYLIELCLVENEALKFKPSMLCASAIYVARSTLQKGPPWSPLLAKHARYDFSQIRECAEMILRFQKAASKSRLKVTYEKFMSCDLSRVAAIKPLTKLPL
ncbi:putative cyclin-B3-1 isoform X2 [Euphorbia lathyris]|uniref:putative cyclin-B3-1 isoform X2 n=1 Tax=Euphorbia lathyris TaxID=212925 RepID=UPI0033135069